MPPYTVQPLRGYSGHQLEVVRQAMVQVTYEKKSEIFPLVVIEGIHKSTLFGRNWLAAIKIKWNELHRQSTTDTRYLFVQMVGTIQGYTADIRLKPEAKPIFKKNRPVPYALQKALDFELQFLQQQGILEPVESNLWATPLVVVPNSNGRLLSSMR